MSCCFLWKQSWEEFASLIVVESEDFSSYSKQIGGDRVRVPHIEWTVSQ